MPLHANTILLIDSIEALATLGGRFSGIHCVSVDRATGDRRGVLSVVFSATDDATGQQVAVKFLDLSPVAAGDRYRAAAFEREPEILQALLGRRRCLQLVTALSEHRIPVLMPFGTVEITSKYFVIEWLDGQVDEHFVRLAPAAGHKNAIAKLELFRLIVLAVRSLHGHEVFHRDLKPDNLRFADREGNQVVVAIDMGTAAEYASAPIAAGYASAVGASAYASIEALAGLAGNRTIAPYTDVYALGCMLFELFNLDLFAQALMNTNPDYDTRVLLISGEITERKDERVQVAQLNSALARFGHGVGAARIDGPGSVVPDGIADLLNGVLVELTAFDYRKRPSNLDRVLRRVDSALCVLRNERAYQTLLRRAQERRKRQVTKLRGPSKPAKP